MSAADIEAREQRLTLVLESRANRLQGDSARLNEVPVAASRRIFLAGEYVRHKRLKLSERIRRSFCGCTNDRDTTRPLHIFVVENHRDTRETIQQYLEMLGHTVQCTASMTKALAALAGADCAVLISDVGLPNGDGWLLLRLLQLPRPIYAIAMSGFGLGVDQLKSKEAGFRYHLLKPDKPEELEAAITAAAQELANHPGG